MPGYVSIRKIQVSELKFCPIYLPADVMPELLYVDGLDTRCILLYIYIYEGWWYPSTNFCADAQRWE